MSAEKKRLDDLVDTVKSPDTTQQSQMKQLRGELAQLSATSQLDGYGLYVYGVVLRKLVRCSHEIFLHCLKYNLRVCPISPSRCCATVSAPGPPTGGRG